MNYHLCVDVILPVFNGRKTIENALKSVIAQNSHLVRSIIVIDDGSTDGTAQHIEALGIPLIRVISTPHKGVSHARNRGIHESKSEWIAFLDADDTWEPEMLRRQIEAASKHSVGFVCSSVNDRLQIPSGRITASRLAYGNFIATSSVLVKSSILREIHPAFTPGMSFAEDYLAWLKCLSLTKGYYLSDKLVNYKISRHTRYRWREILYHMVSLNVQYFRFLRKTTLPYHEQFKLGSAICLGSLISLISILKRIIHSYTGRQTSR